MFKNVASALSKGLLIAAPIHWMAPDPTEREWVILPLKVLEVNRGNQQFSASKNCKQITIKRYQTFDVTLYGVDIFRKLGDLQFVKDLLSKKQVF